LKKLLTLLGSIAFPASFALAGPPRNAIPLDAPPSQWPLNYRLHLDGATGVRLADDFKIPLDAPGPHDIAVEYPPQGPPVMRIWSDGKLIRGPEEAPALTASASGVFPDANLDFGKDFTAMASFEAQGDGTLFAMCEPSGQPSPGTKILSIHDGLLSYHIEGLGALSHESKIAYGKPHTAVLRVREGVAKLWLDGKVIAEKTGFTQSDKKEHVFKVGPAATEPAVGSTKCNINVVRVWKRAIPDREISQVFKDNGSSANTPDFTCLPEMMAKPIIEGGTGWAQALERSDHEEIVRKWDAGSLAEGSKIYNTTCIICHGDIEKPGSLPTAPRFASGQLKNGSDPYSMYLTLTHGYNQMMPQPQYTTAQKYAVIQYIRETFLRPHNPKQLTAVTPTYTASLPKGLARANAEKEDRSPPPHKRMDLGNVLFWTYEVAPENFAQKGIAVRLDEGPGGVSKGRAWMIYDHDTMRMATATTGDFINWRGIALDGSHGTHAGLTGVRHFVNPAGPGWSLGSFEDTRTPARDGKKYGSHPGLKFEGLYQYGNRAVIAARIHDTRVLESPTWIESGDTKVFIRTLNIAESKQPLLLRIAPEQTNVVILGDGALSKSDGFWVAKLPSGANSRIFVSRVDATSLATLAKTYTEPLDLSPLTRGGPPKWPQPVSTTSVAGKEDGLFITDDFPLPHENPWQSWLRPCGFDFTPDGKAAVVAMWNGDVWRVDGISSKAPATLTWRRIAGGLFQPLGVKFRGDDLFVTCRDQIARLRDLNGDGEIDFIECFNDDAQVTEHFHEFAMGLQTDAAGNFYYAKSGRHARDAIVPQHGTLLRVSADGSKTDIIATGLRAANGVCVNPDNSLFVTDQEGYWTPKNRINRVKPGGFYGNMTGYTSVTDTSDSAMEQPVVWITNKMDRSPAELVWVPEHAWGNIGGSLLNLSYGTGRAYIVPHEEINDQWQGAVCELPMPASPTGIMRGRFGADGELYTCGMFAWAGNARQPGGFHRIRRGNAPAQVPLAVHAAKDTLTVTFSEPIVPTDCTMKVWSIKRTANYGSNHHDERNLTIRTLKSSPDHRTVILDIPDLAPTRCYELKINDRILHGTIHQLKQD
jgi:mono/diheme cytochrome c family protein/DNA-binding beta-propeller fold protein YncE